MHTHSIQLESLEYPLLQGAKTRERAVERALAYKYLTSVTSSLFELVEFSTIYEHVYAPAKQKP